MAATAGGGLTDEQFEWVGLMFYDALVRYDGKDVNAADAARLVEARVETLLRRERERIAKEIESAADEWRGIDSPKGVAYRVALSDAAAIARGTDA